jgi:N-acetylglucosamine-6-phosphate deacetylase
MRTHFVRLLSLVLALLAVPLAAQPPNPQITVLRAAQLIDGTGAAPLRPAMVRIEGDRIVEVRLGTTPRGAGVHDVSGHLVVPGFIDVHVHGVEGQDTLMTADAATEIARRLPRYGVTSFCPTTVASGPAELQRLLEGIEAARATPVPGSAHVLPAHLESNFIAPDFRGAQPLTCLRRPTADILPGPPPDAVPFSGHDILEVIGAFRKAVGILTIAPEIEGHLDLIRQLVAAGHIVSLGHSGANFEQGMAGVDAGARHATHLFNRMPPLSHRAPGLIGAVLDRSEVRAEIVCDGYHVHPVVARAAMGALGRERTMAITDGTAGSGLPVGSVVPLGSHTITVTEDACFLPDGTLAGSKLTMDGAFRTLVTRMRASIVDAAYVCATTQARQLGLTRTGEIAPGMAADLAVLNGNLKVAGTAVAGVISGL